MKIASCVIEAYLVHHFFPFPGGRPNRFFAVAPASWTAAELLACFGKSWANFPRGGEKQIGVRLLGWPENGRKKEAHICQDLQSFGDFGGTVQ